MWVLQSEEAKEQLNILLPTVRLPLAPNTARPSIDTNSPKTYYYQESKRTETPRPIRSETSFIMASFGENLKREREMRGIPLREISASTKINLHFLQALEDEEFDKLPGGVFNRGFIRAYSRHLGLDEQKLLGEYDLVLGRKEPFETPRVLTAPPPPLEATSSQARLLAAIAVVMLLIGYTLYRLLGSA